MKNLMLLNRLSQSKWIRFTLFMMFMLVLPALAQVDERPESDNCTSIIVGKLASVDGSTMTSHSCDSGSDRTWINIVPHMKHEEGDQTKVYLHPKTTSGPNDKNRMPLGMIPQVKETYKFINTAYPVMNEHQVAIGETTTMGKRELQSDEGKINTPELCRLMLERAKTAREAIKIADELTKKYGYRDYGECLTIIDPEEVWHFEIAGPGRGNMGAVWAAQRIPDDHIGVSANSFRIRQLDLDNEDYFMASDNVFSVAEEMGYWDPKSGKPFEFCYAYGKRTSLYSRRREWRVLSLAAPSLNLDPHSENFPFSVKPEKKVSVQDILAIFRDTYQGTEFDMTKDMLVRSDQDQREDGVVEMVKSPVANPFMSKAWRQLLNVKRERAICASYATYLQIAQCRSWLPDEIGGVVWLGYDNPATTPHTPFYIGIKEMPASYRIDGRDNFRRDCGWWAFRRASKLSYFRYEEIKNYIKTVWEEIEDKAFEKQSEIEKKAMRLYKDDPEKAKEFLTQYCLKIANDAVDRYWKLGDDIWSEYNKNF